MKPHNLTKYVFASLLWLLASCEKQPDASAPPPVRVAVIGGMTSTGLFQYMAEAFTSRTGIPVEIAETGPKEVLDEEFRAGGIDLFTMHSSDAATRLVADGYAKDQRPWACNELVIVGPSADPAGIRGMTDGAEALKRIAEQQASFVEARNTGSQTVTIALWRKIGINPKGDWLLKDESASRWDVVSFAATRGAYVIVGRIPVVTGKLPAPGMEVLVQGDPSMRRPFVVAEAVPAKTNSRNPEGARKLAAFLISLEGQQLLTGFAKGQESGGHLFFPINNP